MATIVGTDAQLRAAPSAPRLVITASSAYASSIGAAGTNRWRGTVHIASATRPERAHPPATMRSSILLRSDSGVVVMVSSFMGLLSRWNDSGTAGGQEQACVPAGRRRGVLGDGAHDELHARRALQQSVPARRAVTRQVSLQASDHPGQGEPLG